MATQGRKSTKNYQQTVRWCLAKQGTALLLHGETFLRNAGESRRYRHWLISVLSRDVTLLVADMKTEEGSSGMRSLKWRDLDCCQEL